MNPHEGEHITNSGEQQYITGLVGCILNLVDEFTLTDSRVQLLQQELLAICFFHLRDSIHDIDIFT